LDPEVRTLGDHLALSRDLLIAPADPTRRDLVDILASAELSAGGAAADGTELTASSWPKASTPSQSRRF
jgi:hypothetical protein